MFGKFFASAFTGSMVGSGLAVFAVWGYVVANTRSDGTVELNPPILAAILGCDVEDIEGAIRKLCESDEHSRSRKEDGKRLVQKAPFLYFVPTYEDYRAIRDDDDRRQYMRNYMRDYRSGKTPVNVNVNTGKPQLAQAEAEAELEAEAKKTTLPEIDPRAFDLVWKSYPKRAGGNARADALKAYRARLREGSDPMELFLGTERYAAYIRATGKEGSEYVKLGATFFGPARHWEEPWTLPTKPQTEQDRNAAVLDNWLARKEAQNG